MKKFIIYILFALCIFTNTYAQEITRNGKEFTVVSTKGSKSNNTKTDYTYNHNGTSFPIYISANGRAYILITSKNNTPYKKYLGEEISKTICKELGIAYKDKK